MNFLLESSLLRVLEKLFDENSHERESVLLILIKKERKKERILVFSLDDLFWTV